MAICHSDYEQAAKQLIDRVGKTIVMGVPLGLGKPVGLLNALYQLAYNDKSINLTIITGLTLARPTFHNELEKRLVAPILDRLLKDYEDPLYEKARELQQLPKNINVIEFFLSPGKYLHNNYVQQNYINSAYTNVVRDTLYRSINIIGQQVACSDDFPEHYSLSCNSDLFPEIVRHLTKLKLEGKSIAIVGEVNKNLPFMHGEDAVISANVFTDIVDTKHYRALFALPREELSTQDQLIGLYTSCLIKDGSCLQVGIGSLSNAVASALILRHKNNDIYLDILKKLSVQEKFGDTLAKIGEQNIFAQGLYASTEMLSDEYMQLYQENILKKHVYDHIGLQTLLNKNKISETITADIIDILLENELIHQQLSLKDVQFLIKFGIFNADIKYRDGNLILPTGDVILADLSVQKSKHVIIEKCLGNKLTSGKIIHAGFFLGSSEFNRQLNNLSFAELQQIDMTCIARTNTLSWSYELSRLQRQHARFVNSAMMVTLGGVIVSDGLENMREVSGVGGQFDFVTMAQQLENARGIINCHSTRKTKNGIASNIIWGCSNITIPRYLRDIVVTEYGIADCRSKTDSEVIQAMLNITDSRFQKTLLAKAKKCGKLPENYEIPPCYLKNYPDATDPIILEFQSKGYCKPYPFGSDLTAEEEVIKRVLLYLKNCSKIRLLIFVFLSMFDFRDDAKINNYLDRMKLRYPDNIKDYLTKKLFKFIIIQKAVTTK